MTDQLDDIENKVRTFTIIFILEARLKMMEDDQNNRVNSWYNTKWEQALKNSTDEEEDGEKDGEENAEGAKKGEDMAS